MFPIYYLYIISRTEVHLSPSMVRIFSIMFAKVLGVARQSCCNIRSENSPVSTALTISSESTKWRHVHTLYDSKGHCNVWNRQQIAVMCTLQFFTSVWTCCKIWRTTLFSSTLNTCVSVLKVKYLMHLTIDYLFLLHIDSWYLTLFIDNNRNIKRWRKKKASMSVLGVSPFGT